MFSYQATYIDWKGNKRTAFIFADSKQQAQETAMTMQGVFKILDVEESN